MRTTRYTRIVHRFLAISIFLLSFTACSMWGDETSRQLTVYVLEYDLATRNAVKEFNEKQKNCKIVEKVFENGKEQEMANEAAAEFLSGTEPDLVVCKAYMFPNLSKYMEKEVFYDLDKLLKKDKDFKKSDFNQAVLDSGSYKGKQYVLPLDYRIDTFNTTDEILKKLGIELSRPYAGLSEVVKTAVNFKDKTGQGKSYFMSGFSFDPLLLGSDNKFIDQEYKTSSIDNEEFKNLLESYKKLNSSVYPVEEMIKLTTMKDISKLLSEEKVFMLNSPIFGLEYAWETFSTVNENAGARIMPVPSSTGNFHVSAVPERIAAINSKCKNTKAAYDFIKLMMSEELQTKDVKSAIPVNSKAFDRQIKEIVSNDKTGEQSDKIKKDAMSQISDIVKKVDRSSIIDIELLKLIREEVSKYLKDILTAEQTVKELEQQIQNYFSAELQPPKVVAGDNANIDTNGPRISIYYTDYDLNVKNSIKAFKNKYKKVQVDERSFRNYLKQEEYSSVMSTEIMSGEGPDLILFNTLTFNSIRKVMDNGTFLSLDQLMEKDKEFNKEDYFSSILDAGKINGQYFFIPLSSDLHVLSTEKKTLDQYGISPDKMEWSWDSFIETMNRKKVSKVIAPSLTFRDFLNISWSDYIDYDKKTSNFNTDKFKKVLESYKKLLKISTMDEIYAGYTDGPSAIKGNEAVMINASTGNPLHIWYLNTEFKAVLGGDMILLPFPSHEGNKGVSYTTIGDCIAINSKCKNIDEAFNFIKILISKDMQTGDNYIKGIPINKDAYIADNNNYSSSDRNNEKFTATTIDGRSRKEYTTVPISDIVRKQCEDIVSKMGIPVFWDYQIQKILSEEVSEYVNDKKSADQTAKAINDKVNLILNE